MTDYKKITVDNYTLLKSVFKSGCTHVNQLHSVKASDIVKSYDSTSIYKSVWEVGGNNND